MPEISVWPVSSLTRNVKVGSSGASAASVSDSLPLSAELTGSIDMLMTVSGNSIRSSRIGCARVAERVARDRVLEPDDARDLTGDRLGDLLAVIGPDVIQPRAILLLVFARVIHPAPRLEPARVDCARTTGRRVHRW